MILADNKSCSKYCFNELGKNLWIKFSRDKGEVKNGGAWHPPIPSFKPKPDTQRGIKTVLHEKVVIMICIVMYCIVLYCIVLYNNINILLKLLLLKVVLEYICTLLLAPSGALIAILTYYWSTTTPTFSDHTGPQHWTFTFWTTTAI